MVNPAICATEELQKAMAGEWEKAGINNEENVASLCRNTRAELTAERAGFTDVILPVPKQGFRCSADYFNCAAGIFQV